METVFTFWEGQMPDYIKLCMKTWNFDYTLLTYNNLKDYIDLPLDKLQSFTLPQIADVIRVHILRDYGGYWLDTDTIILDQLPKANICGDIKAKTNTIGFLHTESHSDMFNKWAEYQDYVINNPEKIVDLHKWDIFGNRFTDDYVKMHDELDIFPIEKCWPETYMIWAKQSRSAKYKKFYFKGKDNLASIQKTPMLMLHNSWTPDWYKALSEKEVLSRHCTLSNILNGIFIIRGVSR